MKKQPILLAAVIVGLSLTTAGAQPAMRGPMGGPPPGPRLGGGDMAKLFGDNSAFSANLEFHMTGGPSGKEMVLPGKLAYREGLSRFDMNMSEMTGGGVPRQAVAHMKSMGMDQIANITRADKKVSYVLYPGMQGYLENPLPETESAGAQSEYKSEITELGDETVEGHPCVKNKVVLTDKDGKTSEFIAWNATDLKKFPVKLLTIQNGGTNVMIFRNVKLEKPEAALFEPPADFKKHDNMMQMMMSRVGGGMPMPPPGH